MTKEEKQLLLKDLCARLPYGVKVAYTEKICDLDTICCDSSILLKGEDGFFIPDIANNLFIEIDKVKLYLRPMESMTEEEAVEYFRLQKNHEYAEVDSFTIDRNKCLCAYVDNVWCRYCWGDISNTKVLDWLLEKHFDFRGLIWYELALPAPEGMYDFK